MLTISREQIVEYILSQDDYKPINFDNSKNTGCGCLMTQFMRDMHPDTEFTDCGVYSWLNNYKVVAQADDWIYKTWDTGHNTFKTLKERVIECKSHLTP